MAFFRKVINNPITKLQIGKKTYYLSGNLFYSSTHFAVRSKIVKKAKEFFFPYLIDCPTFSSPVGISLTFSRIDGRTFDLDNKLYFYYKILADQLVKMEKLPDDSVKYIRQIIFNYEKGEPKLIVQIFPLD